MSAGTGAEGGAPGPIERALTRIAAICLYAMAAIIAINIITRALGRALIPDDVEIVSELMVLVIMLPLAGVTAAGEHIRVELFTARAGGRGRRLLTVLEQAVGLVFAALLALAAWQGAAGAWASQDYYAGQLDIPMWLGRFLFLAGIAAFLARLGALMLRALHGPG
ncbi:MAG: TRAP transporter small permease subunit [Alphaproteobacteria bacterium]|nr:MAG: TRAP transporter small permease subunit [Alphaproteobacteria bacterium]